MKDLNAASDSLKEHRGTLETATSEEEVQHYVLIHPKPH